MKIHMNMMKESGPMSLQCSLSVGVIGRLLRSLSLIMAFQGLQPQNHQLLLLHIDLQ